MSHTMRHDGTIRYNRSEWAYAHGMFQETEGLPRQEKEKKIKKEKVVKPPIVEIEEPVRQPIPFRSNLSRRQPETKEEDESWILEYFSGGHDSVSAAEQVVSAEEKIRNLRDAETKLSEAHENPSDYVNFVPVDHDE
jgi:hypothetical protein